MGILSRRRRLPTISELLQKAPKRRRQVGTAHGGNIPGHQVGLELRETGVAKGLPNPNKAKPRKDAAAARLREQAGSGLLLAELKRRLTGDRLGSPIRTQDDIGLIQTIQKERDKLYPGADESFLTRAREKIENKLNGQIGFVKRALLRGAGAAVDVTENVVDKVASIVGYLTGKDAVYKGLSGLGIKLRKKADATPVTDASLVKATPYQARSMISVQSSNVASCGWEPHNQSDKITNETVGTLFIQFLNGWLYKYEPCPWWVYDGLLRAPSKGRYVWAVLRRGLFPDGIPYGSIAVEGYERIQ